MLCFINSWAENNQLMKKSHSLPVMRVTNLNSTQPKGFYRYSTGWKQRKNNNNNNNKKLSLFVTFPGLSHSATSIVCGGYSMMFLWFPSSKVVSTPLWNTDSECANRDCLGWAISGVCLNLLGQALLMCSEVNNRKINPKDWQVASPLVI